MASLLLHQFWSQCATVAQLRGEVAEAQDAACAAAARADAADADEAGLREQLGRAEALAAAQAADLAELRARCPVLPYKHHMLLAWHLLALLHVLRYSVGRRIRLPQARSRRIAFAHRLCRATWNTRHVGLRYFFGGLPLCLGGCMICAS